MALCITITEGQSIITVLFTGTILLTIQSSLPINPVYYCTKRYVSSTVRVSLTSLATISAYIGAMMLKKRSEARLVDYAC